jgi:hypothetical protein
MRRSSFHLSALLFALISAVPLESSAQPQGLYFEEVRPNAIRVDGSLREWPRANRRIVGRGRDGVMEYALGYDADGIYVGAEVSDGALVRNARPGSADDGVRLTLAGPEEGASRVHLFILPAVPGKASSGVYVGSETKPRTPLRDAVVVEAITSAGYVVEAFIPFRAIKGLRDFARARGSITLIDADPGRATARISSSSGEPPPITGSGGELGAFAEFLRSEGLEGQATRFDLRADVLGGKKKERVALVGSTIFVGGGDHADGASFETLRLGAVLELHEATLADLTGDGRAEVFLRLTSQADAGTVSEAWVLTFDEGGARAIFKVPYGIRRRGASIENSAVLEPRPKRGPKLVVIRAGTAQGFDSRSLAQDPGDLSLLLPWGPLSARHYDLSSGRWKVASVESNPSYSPPTTGATGREPSERRAPAPPTLDRLIEAARAQLGLPANAPRRFEHESNLAGDATTERFVVIDRTVIVVGPAFRGGSSYFQMQLGVDSPERIRRVHSIDIDGDGREEVIFRINQELGQGVTRCVLLIYRIEESGASQLHAREIARYYQGASVLNTYRVEGKGKRRAIIFSPGEAKGFSESNWPFGPLEGDSVEPLLLPWRDREVRKRL